MSNLTINTSSIPSPKFLAETTAQSTAPISSALTLIASTANPAKSSYNHHFTTIISEIAKEQMLEYVTQPSDTWVGKLESKMIIGFDIGLNSSTAKVSCDNKTAASFVLQSNGVPHVEHQRYQKKSTQPEQKELLAAMRTYLNKNQPNGLVCKPNNGTGGKDIYHVKTEAELDEACQSLFDKYDDVCACPYYKVKNEYRLITLDSEPKIVFSKRRPEVTGNGKDSILDLIKELPQNIEYTTLLNKETLAKVLAEGEAFTLTWKHNLCNGAQAELIDDLGTGIAKNLVPLAISAAKALGVRFASIDIIELAGDDLLILEVNNGVMTEHLIQQDLRKGKSQGIQEKVKNVFKLAIKELLKDPVYSTAVSLPSNWSPKSAQHSMHNLLKEIEEPLNIQSLRDPSDSLLGILKYFGQSKAIIGADIGLNSSTAKTSCDDKAATSFALEQSTIPYVKHTLFRIAPVADAKEKVKEELRDYYKKQCSKGESSFICQPNNRTDGKHVYQVHTEDELVTVVMSLLSRYERDGVSVSAHRKIAREYRVIVLDSEPEIALQIKRESVFADKNGSSSSIAPAQSFSSQLDSNESAVDPIEKAIQSIQKFNSGITDTKIEIASADAEQETLFALAKKIALAMNVRFASIDIAYEKEKGPLLLKVNNEALTARSIEKLDSTLYSKIGKIFFKEIPKLWSGDNQKSSSHSQVYT